MGEPGSINFTAAQRCEHCGDVTVNPEMGLCARCHGPYVCPGCHAVGGERCAPDCIDAEIEREHREAIESGDYDMIDDGDDDGTTE